jgi:hypothetical protein
MGQIVLLPCVHVAHLICSSKIFIPNFIHHHFWHRLSRELGYTYWDSYSLLKLDVVHLQTCLFASSFLGFGAMGLIDWPIISQKNLI